MGVVTLGDTKVDPKLEEQLMAENKKWENYKQKHGIKNWVPVKEKKVGLAPVSKSAQNSVKKGLKRKNESESGGEAGGDGCGGSRRNKKVKRVARLTSSPRKATGRG